jgi:imidazolonepropionase-like amidohydrolase
MTSVRAKLSLAVLVTISLAGVSLAQFPATDIYFAREIWTGKGEPIQDAAMVVVDGVVTAVGPRADISIPPVAVPHEMDGQVIIPGLVAAQTNLSGALTEDRTLTPEIRAIDGFDFFADRFALLESGITTVQVSPGDSRLMPGVGGVVQLAGDDILERILSDQESLRVILSESSRNPPRIYEPPVGPVAQDRPLETTRPQLATLSASLAGLRQILKRATRNETYVSDEADQDTVVDAVAAMIKSKTPFRITAKTAPEIRGAIGLAKEFKLSIVLVDCVGLEPFEKVFSDWKPNVKGVILSGETPGQITNPSIDQIKNQKQPWEYARELIDAGIPVAIRTNTDADLESLIFVAGQFMQDDLTAVELLSAVTSTPAQLMGVDKLVGSLEQGKRADFVVLNDRPFQLHSRVQATYVSGVPTFERKREPTTTVVKADRVYLGDGHFLDGASVVVKGTTVRGIGSSVSSPAEADVRHFAGGVIVPGYVDLGAGLGLGGPLQGTVTLQTKLGDQLYADDPAIDFARRNGITTALLGSNGSSASPVVAFKLGADARVISDPVAIRFKLDGDTAAGIAANERTLKAGKAYADSWIKYETDLKEYEAKLKAQPKTEAKSEPAKSEPAKTEPAKPTGEVKKEEPKKETPAPDKKETGEKKETKDEKKPEQKEVLPDPITGTWEGMLDSERLPEPLRSVKMELVLEESTVTGSVEMLRSSTEITTGSFDRASRELSITLTRRGTDLTIAGSVDKDGNFTASIEMGRMGTLELKASRTVDKSKKPEPKVEKKTPENKDKPEENTDDKKEKPSGDKPKEGDDKKEPEKKDGESGKPEADKKDETKSESQPAEEKKEELKPPKKPAESAALEPYRALFAGKIPAFVESHDLNSIKATAELFAKQYGLRTVIVGADDLAREPGLLEGYDVSVCSGPKFSVTIDKQPPTIMPQLLANERLPFGFQSSGTTGAGQLPSAVQFVVSQGLSPIDALQALTSNPAKMLSKDVNFGSLAPGKDADLVVLSGPPFEYSTKVLAVMIDGQWVYEREEQK